MFVDLSQSQVLKLCALRSLGNLFLGNCTVEHVQSLSPPKLQVADLTITCDSKTILGNGQNGHGLSVFSPDHIRSVSIINPVAASQFLNNFIGNASQGLQQLRCLTLPCDLEVVRAFCPLLHLIPELAELKFARPSLIQHNPPNDENFSLLTYSNPPIPLSKYQGPRQLLPHFVRPGALEHLNLWGTRPTPSDGSMDPMELYRALVGGDEFVSVCDPEVLRTVQILELSVTHVNALMLDAICARFPMLRSLYVCAARGFFPDPATQAWDSEMIMNALLTLPLPSTIQHFRLSSYSAVSLGGLVTEDRLARRKRDLGVKYPNLTFVSLDESDINLTWDGNVVSGKNLQVPSQRIPAGIYVAINVDSRRRWKSALKVLSSEESAVWGDTVTLPVSSRASPAFSVEIRASYEADRMLGSGEVIGKLKMSWDELLNHGDELFDISFPPIYDVHPSLTLRVVVVHACKNQNGTFDSLVDCKSARDTDAGYAQFAEYVTRKEVSHLNCAVQHFQLVLDQCPVSHPDHATALTNLAWARLKGYIRDDLQDIDTATSLFRDSLALRPQSHPDYPLSLYNLAEALTWRHTTESTAADIREAAQLYHELLPLCPEGSYLRSIAAGENGVDYVLIGCINLPVDATDEGIHLRRIVIELCPPGHPLRPRALDELSQAIEARFHQHGSIDDLDMTIQLRRETTSLCPEGHTDRVGYLNNLALSLVFRFNYQDKPSDLDEAISLYEEALRLSPVGHESRDTSLDNLGGALITRFNKRGDIDDITQAVSLRREALTLCPPEHPRRDTRLNNLALALQTRYIKLQVCEDLNETIDRYRESLRLKQLDHPGRHVTLLNLSSALCSRFTQTQDSEDTQNNEDTQDNKDVEEAITLCQESLAALSSLHPDRYFSYMRLQEAYLSRYQILHDPADLSLAVENFKLASWHPTQGFPQRIVGAYNWTRAAEKHGDGSALEAYSTFFKLLDAHLATRSSATSRREAATSFHPARTLPVDAASCAVRCDNLRHAVELVEQGRGQQWSVASRLRTSVEDLESTNPKLAHNYLELSKRVSEAAQSSATIIDGAAADRAATEYRRLTRQWEAAVAEIRDIQAFSRFLLPPLYEDLQVAARQGPVIILIASQYLCSAIIVPTSGEPHQVRFPRITLPDLEKVKNDFATAIQHAARMHPEQPRKRLRVLLRLVWDEIMLPIVTVLQYDLKLSHRSRIWLCPTAAFTSIPLHAANPFRMNTDHSGPEACLEDIYICSYTPTLSALIRSR
ncbi:hypothetical protein BDR03DRAFT_1007702 [Suillus americanus]|nr:hypothetical protein BDR03DRAFT_1007702 [Suillus americanus]